MTGIFEGMRENILLIRNSIVRIAFANFTITCVVTINTLSEEKLIWQPQYTYSEKYGQTYVRSATTQ